MQAIREADESQKTIELGDQEITDRKPRSKKRDRSPSTVPAINSENQAEGHAEP